jgi:hypothetical protein
MKEIVSRISFVKERLRNNEIKLVGGYHDLATGNVSFYI